MKRMFVSVLLVAIVAAFTSASIAEAAPNRVHHRTRHSARVSSGATVTKKKSTKRRTGAASARAAAKPRRHSTKPR